MAIPWVPTQTNTNLRVWLLDSAVPVVQAGWWDGAAMQPASVAGWWDGDSVEPVTLAGRWDGSAVVPL